ncbi:MAG: hypothetical protein IJS60_03320 [Abditibacteriota bacterium]|nr:hypothetical protein [Abditibacteriota bacterium]
MKKDVREKLVNEYIDNFIKHNVKGTKLPSETSIANELNVPKSLVRSSIFYYRQKGFIKTKNGAGSYISLSQSNKYILLSFEDELLDGTVGSGKKAFLDSLYSLASKSSFIPYIYNFYENNIDKLPIPLSQIAGNISIFNEGNYFRSLSGDIPNVNIGDFISQSYIVYLDYPQLYSYIFDIINKYNFKNPLFFTMIYNIKQNLNRSFITNSMNRYIEKKYRLKYVQSTTNMKNASKIVDEAFANLDFIPDLFVFLDDVIYKGAIDIINNDKKRYRNSKIITLSNEDMTFPDNVCQITFDPPSVAEKAFDLLYKLINKEYISEPIIYIDPILINEEIL